MEQMTEEKIARINELYRKQKSVGLTFEEEGAEKTPGGVCGRGPQKSEEPAEPYRYGK